MEKQNLRIYRLQSSLINPPVGEVRPQVASVFPFWPKNNECVFLLLIYKIKSLPVHHKFWLRHLFE